LIKPFEDIEMITAVVNRATDRYRLAVSNRELLEDLKRNAEELERLNVRLTDIANRDGLTGLYNHRYLRESLDQELARSRRHHRRFALIFIDIDHFKTYNDTHGHLAGDALLQTVAKLLQERARGETLAARYGGEEFVLLVPETGAEGAGRYAEAIRGLVAAHPFVGRETQPLGAVTLSLGVASYPEAGEDSTTLIDHADKALYVSKAHGRNTVTVWDPTLG
jgi:diguanylate cyclase (GGDEF)-like protein